MLVGAVKYDIKHGYKGIWLTSWDFSNFDSVNDIAVKGEELRVENEQFLRAEHCEKSAIKFQFS